MDNALSIYFKTHRKRHGLSQKHMAWLLGKNTTFVVSMLENGHRKPNIEMVMIYVILFDIPLEQLVADLHGKTIELLASRIKGREFLFSNSKSKIKLLKNFKQKLQTPLQGDKHKEYEL